MFNTHDEPSLRNTRSIFFLIRFARSRSFSRKLVLASVSTRSVFIMSLYVYHCDEAAQLSPNLIYNSRNRGESVSENADISEKEIIAQNLATLRAIYLRFEISYVIVVRVRSIFATANFSSAIWETCQLFRKSYFLGGLMFPHSGNTRFNLDETFFSSPGSLPSTTPVSADCEWSLCLVTKAGDMVLDKNPCARCRFETRVFSRVKGRGTAVLAWRLRDRQSFPMHADTEIEIRELHVRNERFDRHESRGTV